MKKLEIIMIPVSDQQKAKEFYLKLGFEVLVEAPAAHGQTWLQMGLPNQDVSISLATFHGIIVQTDDIEQEIATLKDKGVEVGNIDHTPWGKFAWMKDADGNSISLHQQ